MHSSLELVNASLSGTIPDAVSSLTALTYVQWGPLRCAVQCPPRVPWRIAHVVASPVTFRKLNLSINALSDCVPDALSKISGLNGSVAVGLSGGVAPRLDVRSNPDLCSSTALAAVYPQLR